MISKGWKRLSWTKRPWDKWQIHQTLLKASSPLPALPEIVANGTRGESADLSHAAAEIPQWSRPRDEQMEMPHFYAQVNEIKESNKRVRLFTDEIEKLHKEALSTADSAVSAADERQIEALMAKVNQMTNRTEEDFAGNGRRDAQNWRLRVRKAVEICGCAKATTASYRNRSWTWCGTTRRSRNITRKNTGPNCSDNAWLSSRGRAKPSWLNWHGTLKPWKCKSLRWAWRRIQRRRWVKWRTGCRTCKTLRRVSWSWIKCSCRCRIGGEPGRSDQ